MKLPTTMYQYEVSIDHQTTTIFTNKKSTAEALETASNKLQLSAIGSNNVKSKYLGEYTLTVEDDGVIGYAK